MVATAINVGAVGPTDARLGPTSPARFAGPARPEDAPSPVDVARRPAEPNARHLGRRRSGRPTKAKAAIRGQDLKADLKARSKSPDACVGIHCKTEPDGGASRGA